MAIQSQPTQQEQGQAPPKSIQKYEPLQDYGRYSDGRNTFLPDLSQNHPDWGVWFERVETFCILGNIWDYVNPLGHKALVQPELPVPPQVILPGLPMRQLSAGETIEEYQARRDQHEVDCKRLEMQHRLNIETYKCKMQRYEAEQAVYLKSYAHIRNLRVHIMESAKDRYDGLLSTVEDPRHQIMLLIGKGRPAVEARFMELMNDYAGKGCRRWSQWVGVVERAWSHCVKFHMQHEFSREAAEAFLNQVGKVNTEFRDHWKLQLQEACSLGMYLNLHEVARVFRDMVLPQSGIIGLQRHPF